MPNLTYAQGAMPSYPGQWGINWTSRGARSAGTDGRVFYVQPNATLAVDDGNTGEDALYPFLTVAAALLRCEANRGDTILVGSNDAWQYGGGSSWRTHIAENAIVDVEGVTILGISPDSLGVPWEPATNGGTCLTVNALGVEIGGFLFQDVTWSAGRGISCVWDGVTVWGENVHIHHCFFDGSIDDAIVLEYSWNNLINDCQFQGNEYGIYSDPLGSGFAYTVIERCLFRDCTIGAISALGGCDDNTVRDCRVFNATALAGGAATDEGFDFTGGDGNMVAGNHFSCVLPVAAPGDFDDLNTSGGATNAWVENFCLNGPSTTNPT